jgi:hypothetical protein
MVLFHCLPPRTHAAPARSVKSCGQQPCRERHPRLRALRLGLVVALVGGALLAMPDAQAGWFTWLWPTSRHEELERAVDVAHKTSSVASRLVESQSQQAAAHAEQNSRVAALLEALADERQMLASHTARFEEIRRHDSVIAAAITAAAPALVSSTALLLGGLAIWAVTRPGPFDAGTAAALIELSNEFSDGVLGGLSPDLAQETEPGHPTTTARVARPTRIRGSQPPRRLPEADTRDDAELPF